MGMEQPSEGSLTVLGEDMNEINVRNLRKLRRNIGPIFQDFKLLDGRTVYENVIIGMRFLDFSKSDINNLAQSTIKRVGLAHR